MTFKLLYGFAIVTIALGLLMLAGDHTATPRFNNGREKMELVFNGWQVVFLGLVFLTAGVYLQRKEEK